MYNPSVWRDYFVMVGGGAAALTGLVFVAMTLHLDVSVTKAFRRQFGVAPGAYRRANAAD